MSPVMQICIRCQRIRPCGCPDREQHRRHRNNVELGRNTRHWRRVRLQAVSACYGHCPGCGTQERTNDPGSKLTADLIGGGNHATATLETVRVRCRRCHGTQDGNRKRRNQNA